MPAASGRAARPVVTREQPGTGRAALEARLACWLARVTRLIAERDTPREPAAGAAPPPAVAPAGRDGAG